MLLARKNARRTSSSLKVAAFAAVLFFCFGRSLFAEGVFFSEYVEGSAYNKALEIVNNTNSPVDLGARDCRIEIYFNGSASVGRTIPLSGVLEAGGLFVVAHSLANEAILLNADLVTGGLSFNGDDALVLRDDAGVWDAIGTIGVDPGAAWGSGEALTADRTLRRSSEVLAGDGDPFDAFDPSAQWIGFPKDSFGGLGLPGLEPSVTVEAAGPFLCVEGEPTTFAVVARTAVGAIAGFAIEEVIPSPGPGSILIGDFSAATSSSLAQAVLTVGKGVLAGTYLAVVSAFTEGAEPLSGNKRLTIEVLPSGLSAWVINEVLADPPPGLLGDANGDGARDASEDEFVEIVNLTGSEQDITSWTLWDASSLLHVFPEGTGVATGGAVLVFGGGAAVGGFGGALVQAASSGRLSLNNDGDTIFLKDPSGEIQAYIIYGSEGGRNESLNLDPDLLGSEYGLHSEVAGSGGGVFSPGVRSDGSPFGDEIYSAPSAVGDGWIFYE